MEWRHWRGRGKVSAAGRTGVSRRKAGERERERERKINLKSGPLPQHGGDEYQVITCREDEDLYSYNSYRSVMRALVVCAARSSLRHVSHATAVFHNVNAPRKFSISHRHHFEPLRILFCGSDEFSNYSLRALHRLQKEQPGVISSIDVICRPDKRSGRGLKKVQQGMEGEET